MAASAQRALPFDVPEPLLYHDITRPGYVAFLRRSAPATGMRQVCVPLYELAKTVERCEGGLDLWISVGEFFKRNRRVVNLWRMQAVFADLDTYKMPALQRLPTDAQVALLLEACHDRCIPPPSVAVFSGRGLQVKWLLSQPLPRSTLPRWQAVQRELNARLGDFGADVMALDASRVLRVVGSFSSRSPEVIRVVHAARVPTMGGEVMPSGVVGYDFDVLADTLLPLQRLELVEVQRTRDEHRTQDAAEKAAREARRRALVVIGGQGQGAAHAASGLRTFVPSVLAWDRLEDLRTLARLRGHEGGLPAGERDLFTFLGTCFLAQALLVRNLEAEARALAAEFAPTWTEAELRSCVSSVMSRARAAYAGEKVEFNGRELDPRYRWRNDTLVDRLGITAEEASQLKTILPEHEARRRDAERQRTRRRAKGAEPRADNLQPVVERRAEVARLKAEGLSVRAIAAQLGVSPGTVSNDLKA